MPFKKESCSKQTTSRNALGEHRPQPSIKGSFRKNPVSRYYLQHNTRLQISLKSFITFQVILFKVKRWLSHELTLRNKNAHLARKLFDYSRVALDYLFIDLFSRFSVLNCTGQMTYIICQMPFSCQYIFNQGVWKISPISLSQEHQ